MIFLIPAALGLLMVNCYLVSFQNSPQPVRRSFLSSLIGIFFFIACSTELLSLFNLINFAGISGSWFLFDLILLTWHLRLRKKSHPNLIHTLNQWVNHSARFFRQVGGLTTFVLWSLLLVTLAVGLISTPNNIDSLSYHLSRLGYWIQNQHVGHYPSHIERAISFSPFSEYVHLHTFLLAGSERFFQPLQWICLIGILGYISLLVEHFAGSKAAMRISLVFAATLPIVLLESMTTQNDLVVAFFILATAFYIFDYLTGSYRLNLLLLSFAIGLGFLTKGTFLFYTLPFGAYFLGQLVRGKQFAIIGVLFLGVFVSTVTLNVPFWYRTYQIFESPIGNISNGNKNNTANVNQFLSSVSKQVFLHLGFISPQNRYNDFLEKQLILFHNAIGVPLDLPNSDMNFKMNKLNFNEDFAHNFIGMWLIFLSLVLFPFSGMNLIAKRYFLLSLASFLIFCFFIGYQIYGSRLHIPFFLLISPAIGLVVSSSLRWEGVQNSLIVLLWISGIPFAVLSVTHPLISSKWFFETVFPIVNKPLKINIQPDKMLNLKRESIIANSKEKMVWGDQWEEMNRLRAVVDSIQPNTIGFYFTEASYDYAYQFILRNDKRIFQHVMVKNQSKIMERKDFIPDCIVAEIDEGDMLVYHGRTFKKKWNGTNTWVYAP